MSLESEDFELVLTPITKKQRISYLYNFLEIKSRNKNYAKQLQKEGVLSVYTPNDIDKTFYILSLSNAPKFHLLNLSGQEDFILHERHIRIDKFFNKASKDHLGSQFFSHWHYTETYKKPADDTTISVRVYFHHNIYLGTIHKIDHNFTDFIADLDGRPNCQDAINIISTLLNDSIIHRMQIQKQLDQAISEIQLDQIKQLKRSKLESILNKCRTLSNELNSMLENYIDTRVELLEKLLLNARLSSSNNSSMNITSKVTPSEQNTASNVAETISKDQTAILTSQAKVIAPNTDQQLRSRVLDFITKNHALQNSNEAIELHAFGVDLLNDLSVEYITCDTSNKPKNKLLQQFINLVKNQKSMNLTAYFIELALAGKAEQAIILFPEAIKAIEPSFYLKLMSKMACEPIKPEIQFEYIKILNFLYQNSDDYKKIISVLGLMSFSAEVKGRTGEAKTLNISMFVLLSENGNYHIFESLIRQSNNFNIGGLLYEDQLVKLLPAVLYLNQDNRYAELLIQSKQSFEPKLNLKQNFNLFNNPFLDLREDCPKNLPIDGQKYINLIIKYSVAESPLYAYSITNYSYNLRNISTLKSLCAQSDLISLILTVSRMTLTGLIANLIMANFALTEAKLVLNEASMLSETSLSLLSTGLSIEPKAKTISCIFLFPEKNDIYQQQFEIVLHRTTNLLKTLSQKNLRSIYKSLMHIANINKDKQLYFNSSTAVKAAIFLSTYFEPNLESHRSIHQALQLMSSCAPDNSTANHLCTTYKIMAHNFHLISEYADQLLPTTNQPTVNSKAKPR